MTLDSLLNSLRLLAERISRHADLLRRSEALTRYSLIDPLLQLMGWDVHDPDQVRPEYPVERGSVDYALLRDGNPLFFIEAKALDGDLSGGTVQNINYCIQAGTRYLIVTDGRRWIVYESHRPVPLPEKEILHFDLTDADFRTTLTRALFLWQPSPLVPVPQGRQPPIEPPPTPSGTIPLMQLQVTPNGRPPARLLLPDGSQRSLSSWSQLFIEVARYLHTTGRLTAAVCPIAKPGAALYLVNTSPQHSDGRSFTQAHRVGNLWVQTKYNAHALVSNTLFLIHRLGENPDDFRVQIT